MEFNDIFCTDSSDIGKMPLLEVEIDTGDCCVIQISLVRIIGVSV